MKWIQPTTLLRLRVRIFGCINVRQVSKDFKSVFNQRLSNTMVKLSMRLEEFLPKSEPLFVNNLILKKSNHNVTILKKVIKGRTRKLPFRTTSISSYRKWAKNNNFWTLLTWHFLGDSTSSVKLTIFYSNVISETIISLYSNMKVFWNPKKKTVFKVVLSINH